MTPIGSAQRSSTAEKTSAAGKCSRDAGGGPSRIPLVVILAAILCVVVAIGAGLQGQFAFGGPRWIPTGLGLPPQIHTQAPRPTLPPAASPHEPSVRDGVVFSWLPILIVLGALVLAAALLLLIAWLRRRAQARKDLVVVDDLVDSGDPGSTTEPDLPTLRRGLALAAEVLERDRTPSDAIVLAWMGLQEAAEDSGVARRAAETPTEFTSRVFAAVAADRTAATTLLNVYLRVRFGTNPATATDVATAREAIARLRATWPSDERA